jgi:tetratricopeptide (TPR) repeat protein
LAGDLRRSMTYARRAARYAEEVFAHDEAIKFLDQARDSADALHRPDYLYEIDMQMGFTQELRGLNADAIASYQRAIVNAPTPAAAAELRAKIGAAYCAFGDPRGLPFLDQALAELDEATHATPLALAIAAKGRFFHYRTEHRTALEHIERARALAEPLGDPATMLQIHLHLAGTHQHLLQFAESDHWARECIALGERRKFPEAIAGGYEFLGENCSARGLWEEGLRFGIKDREFGEKAGSLTRIAWAEFSIAQSTHGLGRIADAREAAEHGLALCEQIGESRLATWMGPMIAIACADLGDDDTARTMIEAGWARAEALGQLVLSGWAMHAQGHVARMRGDLEEAVAWYERYLDLIATSENGIVKIVGIAHAAEVLARAGQLDRAAQVAEQALEVARFAKAPHREAVARRAQGDILAQQSRPAEALRIYDEAIETFTEHRAPLELARTLCRRAELQMSDDPATDRDKAREDLERARAAFAAMGAATDERLARMRLAH